MRLQDLNWMDVERYLETDDRIILITGATEQHAYLSLLTDILIPERIAMAVAQREPVLIAPPLNFGLSEYFASYPGTISLSQTTFDSVLTEVVQSLLHQGFGGFLILNGHSVNKAPQQLTDMHLDGLARIVWHNWYDGEAVASFEREHNLRLDHANWGENFPFNRVADSPDDVKPLVNLGYVDEGHSVRDVLGDGSFGGPYQIDDALMTALFDRVVDEVVAQVQALA
jgi:creatinine amidohydrolase